jgi:hypothetical protein
MRVEVDTHASVALAVGTGGQLKVPPVERHGVVLLDAPREVEAADPVEVHGTGSGAPRRLGVGRGLREAGIEAREKAVEDALGLGKRARPRQPELYHEAVLQRAKEPFDAALGLRRTGPNPSNAEVV